MESQYTQLARMVGMESSEKIKNLFAMIADLDEADLILAMPADVPTLSEKLGRPEEETQRLIDLLFYKGLIFPSFKTDPPTWRGCAHMV